MMARRSETQAARAPAAAGIPFCLSTISACPIVEVANAASQPFWFQLYMIRDGGFMADLIAQAKEASCTALFFTVDMPMPVLRYRDLRSRLSGAPGLRGSLRRAAQALGKPG
jgi:L-lactate dehydrogenase (cytochrome)